MCGFQQCPYQAISFCWVRFHYVPVACHKCKGSIRIKSESQLLEVTVPKENTVGLPPACPSLASSHLGLVDGWVLNPIRSILKHQWSRKTRENSTSSTMLFIMVSKVLPLFFPQRKFSKSHSKSPGFSSNFHPYLSLQALEP